MGCLNKALLSVLLHIAFYIVYASASCRRCEKGWFLPNQKYVYKYEAVADAGYIGTSDERSGMKLSCFVNVITPCQCQDATKVSLSKCKMLERTNQGYQQTDQSYTQSLEKYHVEFVLEDGLIKDGLMTAHNQDSETVLNMKRAIIRTLQLKMQAPEKYEEVVNQREIFGICPMQYTFSKTSPWTIKTYVDITHCDLPSIFEFQFNMKSLIKTVLGGRQVKNISEMIYPFDSSYSCDYKVSDEQKINSVSCLQNQAFRVLKHYGNIDATAMFNISQSMLLKESANALPKDNKMKIPKSKIKKSDIKFVFVHDHRKVFDKISAAEIKKSLDDLVEAYLTRPMNDIPSLFNGFVDRIRQASQKVLDETFSLIKVCPEHDQGCDNGIPVLRQRFYMDALKSCGDIRCVKSIVRQMDGIISISKFLFLYDLAVNFEPDRQFLYDLFEVCSKERRLSCPVLAILAQRFSKKVDMNLKKNKAPILKTIKFYHHHFKRNVKMYGKNTDFVILWILKGFENMATLAQDLHNECIEDILNVAKNKKYILFLRTGAVKVFRAMNYDDSVETELKKILADPYESVSLRSQAFLTLDKYARKKTVKYIIQVLRKEKIQQFATYMASHILNVLESEERTWKERQMVWKQCLAEETEPIPALVGGGSFARGKSSYVEASKTFVFPFTSYNMGAQIEMSIIYDPSNLIPKSMTFKAKGLLGNTDYELMEISLEAEGLERMMQSLHKTHGKPFLQRLMNILHFFNSPQKESHKDFTFFFEEKIINELKELLQMVNFPESPMPSGYICIKAMGGNVALFDLGTLFQYMNIPNLQLFLSETLRKTNLRLIQASRFAELYRSLPSVFGAPFNLTLGVTRVNALNVSSSLGLGQLLPPKNIAMNVGIQSQMVLEFNARMELSLPGLRVHGLAMNNHLNFYGGGSGGMTLTSEDRSGAGVVQYWKSRIHIDNIYEPADLIKIKHRIYLIRSGQFERISADQNPSIMKYVFDGCTGSRLMALLGRKICIQMSYPNVYKSKHHPYTPLTGDVDFRFYVVPNDIALLTYNIDIEREIKKDKRSPGLIGSYKIRCNAPGSKLERQLDIDILHKDHNNYLLIEVKVPELNNLRYYVEFQTHNKAHDYKLKLQSGLGFHGTDFVALHLDVLKQTPIPGIKTDYLGLLDFRLQVMDILFNLTLENSLQNQNKLLLAHMKYHCTQRWPVLFELHADTEHAKQHDMTEMKFRLACETVPNPKHDISMKRNWELLYPGNHFNLNFDLKGSKRSAESTGKLIWNHPLGQEVLWMTGRLIDKGTPKRVSHKYDLTFDHKIDNTIIKLDIMMTGEPDSYDVSYTVAYNKQQMRRRRSWPELSQHFKRVSEGIRRGIYVEKKQPVPEIPKPSKKTTKWTNPLANSPPGPHKDVFMNIFEFLKNGPKKWTSEGKGHVTLRPVLDKHASHPIGGEIVLMGSIDYPTWTRKETIKGAIIYANSIKIMQNGKTMKGHFSVESTKTEGGLLFEFDMSKHKHYLDYSHNLTLWSVTSGEITREFIVDITYRGDRLLNMTQRLLTGPLNGTVDVNYNKNKLGLHNLKIDMDISDQRKILKSKYKSEQTWKGFFTPEYMLNRTSSFEYSFFTYTSNWEIQRNDDQLNMDLQARIKPTYLFPIETDGHVTILHTKDMHLPDVKLKLDMPMNGIKIRGQVHNETEFKLKMDIQKPGQPAISGITWSIILYSPTKIKNVIIWNPHLTKMSTKFFDAIRKAVMISINKQMDISIANIGKPFSDMIVSPTGMTAGEIFDTVVLSNIRSVIPYLDNLPLSSRPVSHAVYERLYKLGIAFAKVRTAIENGEFSNQYNHLQKGFTVILSTIMKYVKERINHPPRILSDYFTRVVMPQMMPSVKSNKIEFTVMHPFIWESFATAPKLTHTSLFFMSRYNEPGYFMFREYLPLAAIRFENKMVTFDGMVYSLPEDFDNDKCIHLLSADLMNKKFAVFREGDAITLVCSKTRVKVSRNCKVYVDGSDKATELPYQCPMKMVTAKMWGPYLIVNSIYGVEISCDPENLKVILDGTHLNNTIGLLGTADGDLGTDMRLPNGMYAASQADFINHFELSGKRMCRLTPEQLQPQGQKSKCFDVIRKRCFDTFASYKSPFLKCFLTVNPKYFLMQCLQSIKGCKDDVMNTELCRMMHLYASHCLTKMPIQMPEHCVMCDDAKGKKWKVSTTKQKRDIVIIVDQNQEINGHRPLYYFMHLFENAKIDNAQMGLVACGGEGIFEHPNVFTMEGRHFGTENTLTMALKTLNEGMKKSDMDDHKGMDHGGMHHGHGHESHGHDDQHGHEGHIPRLHIEHSPHHVDHRLTDLHQALEWASDYPFKPNSGRMIMLFADMTILRNLTDLGSVLATIVEKDITVNIFTNTKELLGKKAVGITASGKVLNIKKRKQIQPTPLIEYFSLIKNTNGILWNIESILSPKGQQGKIMKIINEEFEKQMAVKKCRICKCAPPKHELMGQVQCAASTCN